MRGAARRSLLALAVGALGLVAPAAFSSCGLPKILYLYPPYSFSVGSNILQLVHDKHNYDSSEGSTQSFKGYDIYYRAFDSSSSATTAYNNLLTYYSQYINYPQSFIQAATGLGFVRMVAVDSGGSTLAPPLIGVSSPAIQGNTYSVNLYASSTGKDWNVYNDSPAINFNVYRNNGRQSSFYKLTDYLLNDSDYSGSGSPSTVYFVFFAVAYGLDPTSIGQAVYSMPFIPSVSLPLEYK